MPHKNATVGHWVERISALHRSLMRKFAAEEGLQFVHVEILQYLAMCNSYSDTAQALSEYLGQTKGSISQTLQHLEAHRLIERRQDQSDRRLFHLSLTGKGRAVNQKIASTISFESEERLDLRLLNLLSELQRQNGLRGFGICANCKFNQNPGRTSFVCGLTGEKLSIQQRDKICREHESPLP